VVVPAVTELGVGAVLLLVPPVATVYHFKEVPVALKGIVLLPSQYISGEVTEGAAGKAFMVTTMAALGPSQPNAEL
jgi:hypothetical protein